MRKRLFGLLVLLGALALVFALAGCSSPTGSDDNGGGGGGGGGGGSSILTITNPPGFDAAAFVCENSTPTTRLEFLDSIGTQAAFSALDTKTPYRLIDTKGQPFIKSGTYLVALEGNSDYYFKANVSFTNGSATVDFKTMTQESTLPLDH